MIIIQQIFLHSYCGESTWDAIVHTAEVHYQCIESTTSENYIVEYNKRNRAVEISGISLWKLPLETWCSSKLHSHPWTAFSGIYLYFRTLSFCRQVLQHNVLSSIYSNMQKLWSFWLIFQVYIENTRNYGISLLIFFWSCLALAPNNGNDIP